MYSENSKIVICLDSFSKHFYNILVLFETTALLNLNIYSIFLWLLLPDRIGSLMRLLYLKPRYDSSPAYLMNIFFALKGSKHFYYYDTTCRMPSVSSRTPVSISSPDKTNATFDFVPAPGLIPVKTFTT